MVGDAPPTAPSGLRYGEAAGRWVLTATVLGSWVAFLDSTVVTIALPAVGTDLDAGVTGLTWTANAYTLTLAAFILVGGSLGDRFGRRRLFMVGVTWFGVASLGCAVSMDIGMLVMFRALQGLGAALFTPVALAILQATFRAEDRSRAVGAWSGLAGVAGAVGPLLGGWLVDVASWRWVFLINIPVVLAVVAIASRHVPESRDPAASGRIDVPGAAMAAVGLGFLTYGLSAWSGESLGSAAVQAGVGVGLATLAAFLLWERRAAHPILPVSIFTAPRFGATNLVTFLVYAALGGVFFWLVVALQAVSGWAALAAGTSLLPVTFLMLLFSPRAGALGDRLGPGVPMTIGPLVAAVGVALLARVGPDASYLRDVLPPVTLLGVGLTLTVTPLTTTALGAVESERAGLASGVNSAVARCGGLLLVAVLPALTGLGPGGLSDPAALEPAFRNAMLICSALLALGGIVSWVALRPGDEGGRHGAACPRHHCAVDAPPVAVVERAAR